MVTLRCPRCKRKKRVLKHSTDPKQTAYVEAPCDKCYGGDKPETTYWDALNRQINPRTGRRFKIVTHGKRGGRRQGVSLPGFKPRNHPQQVGVRGARDTVDERHTPEAIWWHYNRKYHFTLDVAANAANAKTALYYDLQADGLSQSWAGHRVWCNPPYSDIGAWVRKATDEFHAGVEPIVMLLPANRCEQQWWQKMIEPFRDEMAARGTFKLSNPQSVDMTLTVTMSVKEWKIIKERLRATESEAEWYLDDSIKKMIEKAAIEFHFYETDVAVQ